MKLPVTLADTAPRAFTRLDLCALTAVLGLLATVLLPALAAGGRGAGSLVCLDNLRRLTAAWVLYAEENQGRVVFNFDAGDASSPAPGMSKVSWAVGWLTWDGSSHNTNISYLTDPRYAGLAAYLGSDPSLFRCPEDVYLSPGQRSRGWAWRVRTYAMNYFIGRPSSQNFGFNYQVFNRMSDFRSLAPGRAFLLTEEHPDSINDPALIHDPSQMNWVDVPGALHGGSSWISFADGHVERRVWSNHHVLDQVRFRYPTGLAAGDADFLWLSARTSELR